MGFITHLVLGELPIDLSNAVREFVTWLYFRDPAENERIINVLLCLNPSAKDSRKIVGVYESREEAQRVMDSICQHGDGSRIQIVSLSQPISTDDPTVYWGVLNGDSLDPYSDFNEAVRNSTGGQNLVLSPFRVSYR